MPNPPRERKRARELAAEYLQKNDPTGWFDALYREAESGATTVITVTTSSGSRRVVLSGRRKLS